jgi:hypothetical protein
VPVVREASWAFLIVGSIAVRTPNPVDANRPVAVNVPGVRCLPCMQLCLALVPPLESDAVVLWWLWGRKVEGGESVGLVAVLADLWEPSRFDVR